MRLLVLCVFCLTLCLQALAQDTGAIQQPDTNRYHRPGNHVIDSVAAAMAARQKFIDDSVATQYIRYPDSNRVNMLMVAILKDSNLVYHGYGFLDVHFKSTSIVKEGSARQQRDPWIIGVIVVLVLYTGIVNMVMDKDIAIVFHSFYNKRSVQAGKEESLLNSRAFLALFVLFGLISGLFIYQVSVVKGRYYPISGFQLFVSLSVIIVVLFALKLLVLRLIGFIFDVNKVVGEYISILYLTYFNIAFVFLPLTLCFCLLPAKFAPVILGVALVLTIVIFVWQYLRSSVNIISNFRFHKFYLFIYLCALEICPVLILIKALNI
ncbi:DUF4271 domain-containing protein [Mucilaginibacter mali]|uniref:DUF4271 domain-containing protein n=1 Tax=Mucilaginibacter mali TaxID=2740462 RepID=A0A7D4UDV4_9SPHI|nr:DUF4271 domain-containing protein [Mucilaginibacter mali]QKJ30979.1 DUF4271 domain-containing protein [Mucilaginibacter mali]